MPEVKLTITPIEGFPGKYKVEISGSGFEFAVNKEARWKLRGDDPFFDDNIIDPHGSGVVGAQMVPSTSLVTLSATT